jgi:microcystin-dependent protein
MPVKRGIINLAVNGNMLAATDAATDQPTADVGLQGEDGAIWLHIDIPAEWQDLTVRLKVIAINGAYDESLTPVNSMIDMPLRQGVTVPGALTVSLQGSDDSGLRRTADLKSLMIKPAAVPANAIASLLPLDFEALKEVVDTQVVHSITGSGGALVTKTDDTTVNINVTGAGGDMLQANYANGAGQINANKTDHALYADSAAVAAAAQSAQSGSALNSAIVSKQATLATGGSGGSDILSGVIIKSLRAAGIITLSSDANSITIKAQDYPGVIKPYAGAAAPTGTLLCDGSAVSRTTYAALFAVIWAAWGAGDGSTTFNLPNLKGRTLAGRDTGQTEFASLAQTGGEKAHTLSATEMPSHNHSTTCALGGINSGVGWVNSAGGSGWNPTNLTAAINSAGGGGSHNNLQPYAVVNYIIVY